VSAVMRRILAVVLQEGTDALRSRRALLMLGLYLAAAILTVNAFISVTRRIESELAEALQLPRVEQVGGSTEVLWQSPLFRRMLARLVGDAEVAEGLIQVPPVALFYGWAVFFFTPALVMLFSASRIAEDTDSGSARYILMRTTRGEWVAGKFAGQALWVALALACAGAGAWLVAYFRLPGMDGWGVARGLFVFSFKAWVYALAFAGMALGLSQWIRLPVPAMAAGFAGWLGSHMLYGIASHFGENGSSLWIGLHVVLPQGHKLDLWRTGSGAVLAAGFFLLVMGAAYLLLGYAWFRRRDL